MEHSILSRPFELKEVTSEGVVTGHGSIFGNVDQGGDVVEKGAFTESLGGRQPKMFWGHEGWEIPIGIWDEAAEDDKGLFLHGRLDLNIEKARDVHSGLKMKTIDSLSIGYLERRATNDRDGIRHLEELELFEVSFVNFPMNELARVDSVKSQLTGKLSKRQLEEILRGAGFSQAKARALMDAGYRGLFPLDEEVDLKESLERFTRMLSNGN